MPWYVRRATLIQVLALAFLAGQSGCEINLEPLKIEYKIPINHDTTPPSAVDDLAAAAVSSTNIRLTWTATGDDSSAGYATNYEVRESSGPIDSTNFALCNLLPQGLYPRLSGLPETLVVTSFSPSTTHYFALRAGDDNSNYSKLSNVASATTSASAVTSRPRERAGVLEKWDRMANLPKVYFEGLIRFIKDVDGGKVAP